MSESRQIVLDRIRAGLGEKTGAAAAEYAALPRGYLCQGQLTADQRAALMIERLHEYDAEVTETTPNALPQAIAAALTASGRRRFLAPAGLPVEWLAPGFEWLVDHGLSIEKMEQAEGVVTTAFCGVADSGTIVLHHGPEEGRRALTLLPDWHLCVLRTSQIVEVLPEYLARCAEPPQLATTISGPSATADIEMTRIKGVHGPRFLHVIVVDDAVKA